MSSQLQAGAAQVTITPPLGGPLAGSFGERRATDVLSDLCAKALVLDDGVTPTVIITLDLCWIERNIGARISERVAQMTGIPTERVMITCTHTHSGPAAADAPWYEINEQYLSVLVRRSADVAALAYQRRREARLLVGSGSEESLMFNRRFWMANGTLRTNPPLQSPDIVRPAGPLDPEVGVVRVEDPRGKLIALLVNYALHVAVVAGQVISADYPGKLSSIIQEVEGTDAVVLFSMGCGGDINHLDVSKPGPQFGQARADEIGTVLAGEVLKVGTRLTPVTDATISYQRKVVELDMQVPTEQELDWARKQYPFSMDSMDAKGLEAVRARSMCRVQEVGGSTLPAEVQVLALGDLAYITMPSELFVELGLEMKRRSPFRQTFIGTLNGSTASQYIPTRKAYDEGGYEVANSQVKPGSGEKLVETAIELLNAVKKGQ